MGEGNPSAIYYEHSVVSLVIYGSIRSNGQHLGSGRLLLGGLWALRFDFFNIVLVDDAVDADAAAAPRPRILVDGSLTIFAYL